MGCGANESYFDLEIPQDYQPSVSFEERTLDEWIEVINNGVLSGQLREELAEKIIRSLNRLPELESYQDVFVSFSGGKDSQAIFLLSRMKYPKAKVRSMFADTKDEWPETLQAIDEFEKWIDTPIAKLDSEGIHYLLREHIPCWPRKSMRHCTKNLKMLPQRDYLDRQLYGQDRKNGKHGYRNEDVGNGDRWYIPLRSQPLLLSGERWYESVSRSKLSFDERVGELLRWTHRPVLDWFIEDIWEFIFWMQAPINPVYAMGIERAACAGCIFADSDELVLLAEYHPNMLKEWVVTEQIIGVPRPFGKQSLMEIYTSAEATGKLGTKKFEGLSFYAEQQQKNNKQLKLF